MNNRPPLRRSAPVETENDGIIEGRNAVIEALRAGVAIDKIFLLKGERDSALGHIASAAREKGIVVVDADRRKLDNMSRTHSHQGVIAQAAVREYASVDDILAAARDKDEPPLIVVCDELSDPHNLGAVIRTADAAGAHGVIIPKNRAVGLTGTVARTSAGALNYTPVAKVTNLTKTMEELKEKGLYDNTIIIYASDHGSHFKTRNTDSHLNGYDDYKRTCHDGALHVPLVIAGGPFKGGVAVEELVSTESLPKTILALAGVDVGDAMIGEDLLDVVEKKDHNRPNQVFAQISESRVGRCVRTADYLYSVYAPGVNGGEAAASDLYADDFLYDLKVDPWQLNNVVADPSYAQVKEDMRARLADWIERAEGTRPAIVD